MMVIPSSEIIRISHGNGRHTNYRASVDTTVSESGIIRTYSVSLGLDGTIRGSFEEVTTCLDGIQRVRPENRRGYVRSLNKKSVGQIEELALRFS